MDGQTEEEEKEEEENDDDEAVQQQPTDDTATETVSTPETMMISEDPGLWPPKLTDRERIEIVKKGPMQIKKIASPPEPDPQEFYKRELQYDDEKRREDKPKVAALFRQYGCSVLFWLPHLL